MIKNKYIFYFQVEKTKLIESAMDVEDGSIDKYYIWGEEGAQTMRV